MSVPEGGPLRPRFHCCYDQRRSSGQASKDSEPGPHRPATGTRHRRETGLLVAYCFKPLIMEPGRHFTPPGLFSLVKLPVSSLVLVFRTETFENEACRATESRWARGCMSPGR